MQHKVASIQKDFAYAPLAAVLNLGESEKKVWLTLFTFQGQNDYCFPSLEAIRKRMGMGEKDISLSRISRITTQLVKKGWLEKWRKGRRNRYRVLIPGDMLFVPDFGTLTIDTTISNSKNKNESIAIKQPDTISQITKSQKIQVHDKKKYKIPHAGRFGYDQLIKRPDEDDSYFLSKHGQGFVDYARSIGFTPSEYEEFLKAQEVSNFEEYLIRIGIEECDIKQQEEDYNARRADRIEYHVA